MIGADLESLRALASSFEQSAARLRTISRDVRRGIQLTAWLGPFAVRFRHLWDSEHSLKLKSAAESLEAVAGFLRSQAAEQEKASAAGTATSTQLARTGTTTRSVIETDPNVGNHDGVRIIKVRKDGVDRYVVHIAGTELVSSGKLFDPFENIPEVLGREAQTMRYVEAQMKAAGITSKDQVMIVGYSQGGLIAQNLANSGRWGDAFIVTRASPEVPGGVGDHDILRFEVEHDLIVDQVNPFGPAQKMLRSVGVHGSGTDHLVRGSGGSGLPSSNPLTDTMMKLVPGAGWSIHTNGLAYYGKLADEFDASTDPEAKKLQDRMSKYLGAEIVEDSQ